MSGPYRHSERHVVRYGVTVEADDHVPGTDAGKRGRGIGEQSHDEGPACRCQSVGGAVRRGDRYDLDAQERLRRPDGAALAQAGQQRLDAPDRDREADVLGRCAAPPRSWPRPCSSR